MPGEVDYRLASLPPRYKGIVVWVGEAKVRLRPPAERSFLFVLQALARKAASLCEPGRLRDYARSSSVWLKMPGVPFVRGTSGGMACRAPIAGSVQE